MKNTLIDKLHTKLNNVTFKSLSKEVFTNAKNNLKFISFGTSLKDLLNFNAENKNAIIVGGGPSLRKINQIKVLKKYKKNFIVIACDGALYYLLSNNIIPDLVVTFDPHPTRIIRWFGNTNLKKKDLKKDDYFSRQDIEKKFNDEIESNKKIIFLFNKNAKKLKIALCTSSSKLVVKRLVEAKADIYWWNAFLDDPQKKTSLTRKIFKLNKLPIVNTGGNVGSAAWMMAESVFNCKNIALIGMDFGYYIETPIRATQYYDVLLKICKDKSKIKKFYSKIYNKKIKKTFYSDYVYMWYKKCLIEMINNSKSNTYNCTMGGILLDKKIKWSTLEQFCKKN